MDIYILNKSLERIGIIDSYDSIIWTKRYYSAGDFELYIPASVAAVAMLKKDYYLQRDDDDGAMIIEDIEIQTDAENGDFLIVSGRSLESILARRIVWNQTNLNGRTETAIRRIVTENCIVPTQSERAISRLILGEDNGFSETIEQQVTGDNLAEWLETVCIKYGYGWKITINDGAFVFQIYKGIDRSYDAATAAGIPFVVFSPEFDNLTNSNYKSSSREFKNAALVLGEGEGAARRRVSVGNATDLQRYEIFVDARDVSSNDGEITDKEYDAMLLDRGEQKVAEHGFTESFDGEVMTDGMYQYRVDYDLGDTVQIDNEYGVTSTARIIEIIENEDASGHKVVPTLAAWSIPTKYLLTEDFDILTGENGDRLMLEE